MSAEKSCRIIEERRKRGGLYSPSRYILGMKYQYRNELIPQSARKELNDKILYLIDQNLAEQSGVSCEDIFNAYTGEGGLHGLHCSDFANYHEFAEAKKEIENGQFFTPPACANLSWRRYLLLWMKR